MRSCDWSITSHKIAQRPFGCWIHKRLLRSLEMKLTSTKLVGLQLGRKYSGTTSAKILKVENDTLGPLYSFLAGDPAK